MIEMIRQMTRPGYGLESYPLIFHDWIAQAIGQAIAHIALGTETNQNIQTGQIGSTGRSVQSGSYVAVGMSSEKSRGYCVVIGDRQSCDDFEFFVD